MDTIIKTVKQYSKEIDVSELKYIANQYRNVKNYIYSRYSGINSICIQSKYKKEIRDIWVKSKFAEQWKLPARYWKMALDEAISNIKTEWSSIKNRIKICIRNNQNLSNEDKHYIRYVLKADKLYQDTLTHKNNDVFKCPKCGELHADSNASINVLNRKDDKEISLYTPYMKVREILETRIS